MTELEKKINDKNEAYMEYQGIVFPYTYEERMQYGAYDAFDMNPAALAGPTQRVHCFRIGKFETKIVSDSDNLAHDFKVYAKDIDETHFEIILTYSLMRSGQQEVKMGIMEKKLLSDRSEVQILLATGFKAFEMLTGLVDSERFSYFLDMFVM